MKRSLFVILLVASTSLTCVTTTGTGNQLLVITPILDSTFVGQTLPPRTVYLLNADGSHQDPGHVHWSISPLSVATIDSSGAITAVSKGTALVVATVGSAQSGALVAVSRPLDVTLLLDTILLMPGDTLTPPILTKQQNPGSITVRFDTSPAPSVITIDSLTGRITAVATGGPIRYVVRASVGVDTVTDTGGVQILTLLDTTNAGTFYMTAFGTAIRHQRGIAYALNYTKFNDSTGFQLRDTVNDGVNYENLSIVLPDSVGAPVSSPIDSIGLSELNTQVISANPICRPPRPWAVWYSLPPAPGSIVSVSHGTSTSKVAGQIVVTMFQNPAGGGGGAIIGGRYAFSAQRSDLYGDALGAETVRGTFVAPLRTRSDVCLF